MPQAADTEEYNVRLHLIGVGGTGMSAAAKVLREAGCAVGGSDLRADPPTGPALAAWGIPVAIPYDAAHLEPAPDLVVVGNAVGRDNVESVAAVERALAVTHMPALMQPETEMPETTLADRRRAELR